VTVNDQIRRAGRMASFLRVGNEWLNLDHVERIEHLAAQAGIRDTDEVSLHFTTGRVRVFRGQELEQIESFLTVGKGLVPPAGEAPL
jgi:hypothetical protein